MNATITNEIKRLNGTRHAADVAQSLYCAGYDVTEQQVMDCLKSLGYTVRGGWFNNSIITADYISEVMNSKIVYGTDSKISAAEQKKHFGYAPFGKLTVTAKDNGLKFTRITMSNDYETAFRDWSALEYMIANRKQFYSKGDLCAYFK